MYFPSQSFVLRFVHKPVSKWEDVCRSPFTATDLVPYAKMHFWRLIQCLRAIVFKGVDTFRLESHLLLSQHQALVRRCFSPTSSKLGAFFKKIYLDTSFIKHCACLSVISDIWLVDRALLHCMETMELFAGLSNKTRAPNS
jgi:hypothetical protein